MWSTLEDLFTFLLRDAAQNAEFLALRLELFEVGEPVKHLLLSLIADGARIVENQIGLLDRLDLPIAFLDERPDDLFRVVDVHLAAESFEVKSFVPRFFVHPRHIKQV